MRTWGAAITHRHGTTLRQNSTARRVSNCKSFWTPNSGDKLLYGGACMHGPHAVPFFGWARRCRDTEPTLDLTNLVQRR